MSSKSYIYPFGILLALLLVVVPFACHGFVVDRFSTTLSQTKTRRYTLLLFAKKATAKKRKKTSGNNNNNASGGGFGAGAVSTSASSKKSENTAEDYAVFPALEPSVKETLVRAEGAMDMILTDDNNEATSGELRNEIYQRLDQIYGFEHFNYEEHPDQRNQEAEAEPMSLQDLMSGSASLLEKDDDDSDNSSSSEATSLPISKLPPFEKIQVLHVDPLVLQIDDFFAPEECDAYIQMTTEGKQDIYKTGSLTVGKDEQSQAQRTSTTWFNHYKNVPALMAKASRLLGLDGIDQWEEPQTVRCVLIYLCS